MNTDDFLKLCKDTIAEYLNIDTDDDCIKSDDIYVVWSCKTLQNNKALLSTDVREGIYFEMTYNGDKKELYVDVYTKFENFKIGC